VVLVEGEVPAETSEVVFQSPEAVGVGANLLCPGALRCRFLLEIYKTLFVVKDPLGVFKLLLETVLF
jgi:hypothetical protein